MFPVLNSKEKEKDTGKTNHDFAKNVLFVVKIWLKAHLFHIMPLTVYPGLLVFKLVSFLSVVTKTPSNAIPGFASAFYFGSWLRSPHNFLPLSHLLTLRLNLLLPKV